MSQFHFRRVDRADLQARAAVALWQSQGMQVQYQSLPTYRRYLQLSAFDDIAPSAPRWQGYLDLDEWIESVAPDLARLAREAPHEEQLLQLFGMTEQALSLAVPALKYTRLLHEKFSDTQPLPAQAMPCLHTEQGKLWLQHFPEPTAVQANAVAPALLALPLDLQFMLGHSHISTTLLSQLCCGDALMILNATPTIAILGMVVGRYVWTKEGFIVEQLQDDYIDHEFDDADAEIDDFYTDAAAATSVAADTHRSIARVPVRLDFMLSSKRMTMGELSQLSAGKLLELAPGIEKNIRISANGVLLAQGELIQIDDRLAVEITELYSESHHAE